MDQQTVSAEEDVLLVGKISILPFILKIVSHITTMGFSAVARVTKDRWIACEVHDGIKFGLIPGGELKVDTTICHEIRQNGNAVIIDHVQHDELYRDHHTPAMYGFQSYISVPVIRQNGEFFGTLCAIDPNPNLLNTPHIIEMFRVFAELISFHIHVAEQSTPEQARATEEYTFNTLWENFTPLLKDDPFSDTDIKSKEQRSARLAHNVQLASRKVALLLHDLKVGN